MNYVEKESKMLTAICLWQSLGVTHANDWIERNIKSINALREALQSWTTQEKNSIAQFKPSQYSRCSLILTILKK